MKPTLQHLVAVLVTEEALSGRSKRYQRFTCLVIIGTIGFAATWTLCQLI